MREETLRARWDIDFPQECDASTVCALLDERRLYEWSWDHFIWDLPYLYRLLTERPAVFDYLFVTRFLVARASHLLMAGPFKSSMPDVWGGIARHKLQYAGVYHHIFLNALREVTDGDDPIGQVQYGGRLFVTKILELEREFLRVVEVIDLMPDSAEDFTGYPLSCWVKGELCLDSGCSHLLPPAVAVKVQVQENAAFQTIRPCRKELATLIMKNGEARLFREKGRQITATDRDLQRMCRVDAVGCTGEIDYDDNQIGYYRTMASPEKNSLRVVCGDRTMILTQDGGARPGTYPKRIYPGVASEDLKGQTYLVEFDNGVADYYRIDMRAHSEQEALLAPVRRLKAGRGGRVAEHKAQRLQSSPRQQT